MIEPQVLMTVSNLGGFISRRGHQFLMVGILKKKKKNDREVPPLLPLWETLTLWR